MPETIHYKKLSRSVFKTRTIYLENDNTEEVNFYGETLIFTLQMIKIWSIKWTSRNLKLIVIALVKSTTAVQKTLLAR